MYCPGIFLISLFFSWFTTRLLKPCVCVCVRAWHLGKISCYTLHNSHFPLLLLSCYHWEKKKKSTAFFNVRIWKKCTGVSSTQISVPNFISINAVSVEFTIKKIKLGIIKQQVDIYFIIKSSNYFLMGLLSSFQKRKNCDNLRGKRICVCVHV